MFHWLFADEEEGNWWQLKEICINHLDLNVYSDVHMTQLESDVVDKIMWSIVPRCIFKKKTKPKTQKKTPNPQQTDKNDLRT